MTKAIQRTFLKQRSGSIINMSSVVEWNAGQTNYAASKAGVIGFQISALELGSRNIRCIAGFIETEMT
jgi:3-oxoacyl-[acyl-carrier protein] reductase